MNFKVKQILSIALCIILTVFLLPITVSAETGDTYKYSNAYDVQRDPLYPRSGEKEALHQFQPPIIDVNEKGVGIGKSIFGDTTSGKWTLTSVGNYDPAKPYQEKFAVSLETLVSTIIGIYGINYGNDEISEYDEKQVEIFELKNDDKHICYGVIVARFDDDSLLFLGTSYYEKSGAGYYIANPAYSKSDRIELTTKSDFISINKLNENTPEKDKNIDNNSPELNDKQDNKDIDNNSTELNNKQDNSSTEPKETVDIYNPNTGDNSNAILYISLMSISIMSFAGIIIYRKKHSIR